MNEANIGVEMEFIQYQDNCVPPLISDYDCEGVLMLSGVIVMIIYLDIWPISY